MATPPDSWYALGRRLRAPRWEPHSAAERHHQERGHELRFGCCRAAALALGAPVGDELDDDQEHDDGVEQVVQGETMERVAVSVADS